LNKRFSAALLALVFMFVLTTTAFAATTETFYGGYRNTLTKGSIVVELTNITSVKNVVLSETEAVEYFDKADYLDMAADYDYDSAEVITIRDILTEYNNKGGVPVYYADSAPVVVTAKTALRSFFFSYKGDTVKYDYRPIYYSFDEYIHDFENKKVYTEPPGHYLIADGTTVSLNEPGRYIFVITDNGLVSSSPAGMFCVHIGDSPATTVTEDANKIYASPTTSRILVNGKAVEFDAYVINGNNYFKLRDFAQAVNNTEKNFEVTWDDTNKAINLISNKPYSPVGGELAKGDGTVKVVTPNTSKIYKDGEEISLTAYTINGNNYFKLRDMAKAFDIGVDWDGQTNTVIIDTSKNYVE